VWDWRIPDQKVSDRPYYRKIHPAVAAAPVTIRFAHLAPGTYRLELHRTGFEKNDPQSAWLAMGEPATLSAANLAKLKSLTRDEPERSAVVHIGASGYSLSLPMRTHDVVLVTMTRTGEEK
jgi:xylan 1,4-beta-xylosidase